VLAAVIVVVSRVYLNYHSVEQVATILPLATPNHCRRRRRLPHHHRD
jgi:hypothetical protein